MCGNTAFYLVSLPSLPPGAGGPGPWAVGTVREEEKRVGIVSSSLHFPHMLGPVSRASDCQTKMLVSGS